MREKRRKNPALGKTADPSVQAVRGRILGALNNERYVARTISGIAKEAHLKPDAVKRALANDAKLKRVVKVYPRRASSGKILITTHRNFSAKAPFKDKFIDLFASKRMELDDVG